MYRYGTSTIQVRRVLVLDVLLIRTRIAYALVPELVYTVVNTSMTSTCIVQVPTDFIAIMGSNCTSSDSQY